MKRTLAIVIALFAMASSAIGQRIPDSSVTGSARATVGINPAALTPGGDSGIQNAYDPSWTMLIGNPSQTLLPHKFSINGLNFTFLEGGNVRIDASEAVYSCVNEYMGGRNGYNRDRCTYSGQRPVSFTMGAAPGRGNTRLSFSFRTYAGSEYVCSNGDDSPSCGAIAMYQVTLGPIVNSLGALTGFTFQTADDDYFYGNFNNPGLTRFPGSGSGPFYFCDPQNSCGGYRGQFPVSN